MFSLSAEPTQTWAARTTVSVSVPATSANLGPGFDSFGLALDSRDDVRVDATPAVDAAPTTTCTVRGCGADDVPTDGSHLIAATIRAALTELAPEASDPNLALTCVNCIPHGQGLGSSAAAIVAGLAVAWDLAATVADLDPAQRVRWLVHRASTIEGHGDNAAAAVLGGAVVAWLDDDGYTAARLPVDPTLSIVTAVPETVVPTRVARAVLSDTVSRADAVFTGARTALLVAALGGRRELMLPATADRLHQDARAEVMPATFDLVTRLRQRGIAAVVSGAGPAVLTFGAQADDVRRQTGQLWRVESRTVGRGVEISAPVVISRS